MASSEEYQQAPAHQELFDDELHGAGLRKNVEAFHGQVYGVGENILIAKQRTWLLWFPNRDRRPQLTIWELLLLYLFSQHSGN